MHYDVIPIEQTLEKTRIQDCTMGIISDTDRCFYNKRPSACKY